MRIAIIIDPALSFPVDEQGNTISVEGAAEPAAQHPALRSLLANLSGAGSPFSTFSCKTWSAQEEGDTAACIFVSAVGIIFQHEADNSAMKSFIGVAHRLAGLLHTEAEFLSAEILICRAVFSEERSSYCLQLTLSAKGSTASQAQMRWGLGLAHVQQALLFVARELLRESGA
jgi:hypothetical protein